MTRSTKTPGDGEQPTGAAPHPTETLLGELAKERADPFDAWREQQWVDQTQVTLAAQIAALRRRHTPDRPVARRLARISDELHGLDRAALLLRLERLRSQPQVQIAHMELAELSDDDLRQLIAEGENIEATQG